MSIGHQTRVFLFLALLVFLLRFPSLEQPFDNDGGAHAYHARLILAGEPLYGSHHPGHHLPGIYYTYALALLLLGDSVWAVKFFMLLWTVAAVYLLYRLGALAINQQAGLLAAVFLAILSSHLWLWGTTAGREQFANLPRIAAVLVLFYLVRTKGADWRFMFVGLLGAVAFLFKAVYLSPLVLAGITLAVEWWRQREYAGSWRAAFRRAGWMSAGFLLGILPVLLHFAWLGLWSRFTLVFTLGQGYVQQHNVDTPLLLWPIYPLFGLWFNNGALLILGLAGFFIILVGLPRVWRAATARQPGPPSKSASGRHFFPVYICIWLILSYLEGNVTAVLYLHYYLLLVPPLALLAAYFLVEFWQRACQLPARPTRTVARLALMGTFVLVLAVSVANNATFYNRYVLYKSGLATFETFVTEGWPGIGPQIWTAYEVANYVAERTTTDDRLYYWSDNAQLYYLANRRSALDVIWPIHAGATAPYQRIFEPSTKYVILGEVDNLERPDWLYSELGGRYVLETVIQEQEIYRRVD